MSTGKIGDALIAMADDTPVETWGAAIADGMTEISRELSALLQKHEGDEPFVLLAMEMFAANALAIHPAAAEIAKQLRPLFAAVGCFHKVQVGDTADDGTAGPEAHL